MKVTTFLQKYPCCRQGIKFALCYDTMSQVWDACSVPEWLLFIYGRVVEPLTRKNPLTIKLMSAALDDAIKHRNSVAHNLNGSYLFDLCVSKTQRYLEDPNFIYPESSHFGMDEHDRSEYTRCCDANTAYNIAANEQAELSYYGAYYLDKVGMLLEMTTCDSSINLLSMIFKQPYNPEMNRDVGYADLIKSILPNPFQTTHHL